MAQCGFYSAWYHEGRFCIGDTSLIKHIPKYIKSMININNITRRCETYIITMLLQLGLNKWRLIKGSKFE